MGLLITYIPVTLAYIIDFLQTEEFSPEFEVYIPIVLALLIALQNYLSHRGDTKLVKAVID